MNKARLHPPALRRPTPKERSLEMSDILLRAQVRVQTTLYSLRHRQEGQASSSTA